MIRKLLIANRGEIACRIIRTCRGMGITTVAVYADVDLHAPHVKLADEAIHIGAAPATESYLNIAVIIAAAQRTQADAIHPGYGFLAENADFAQAVAEAGIVFIGPSPAAIQAMGKKREAKLMLKEVPLVPGYQAEDQSDDTLINAAEEIGYPIMVKASAGGGGKGMRRVDTPAELPDALAAARREAAQAFGDDTLILEKFVQNPRHIEIQILGDTHGNVIALGERECSIQRRHQKIIEEAPSPAVDSDLRERMSAVAVKIGQQLDYVGAGTVEFLLDAGGNFYFMEMNTRLQVEHPVTEYVYNVDLVELQIAIAEGAMITDYANLQSQGHAIEVRIYAEDPGNEFLPSTGDIHLWNGDEIAALAHTRCDSGIQTHSSVTTHYDPMLAKLITYGETRKAAIRRMEYALRKLALLGLRHNIAFLRSVINHPDFTDGDLSTGFLDARPELMATVPPHPIHLIAAAIAQHQSQGAGAHWRNNPYAPIKTTFNYNGGSVEIALTPGKDILDYSVQIEDTVYQVHVIEQTNTQLTMTVDGHYQTINIAHTDATWWVHASGQTVALHWQTPLPLPGLRAAAAGSLRAPMPGQVVAVHVEVGQTVRADAVLIVLEAMKMEHRIRAPHAGTVEAIYFNAGDTVQADAILLDVTAE